MEQYSWAFLIGLGLLFGLVAFLISWGISPLVTCWWMKIAPSHRSENIFVDPKATPNGYKRFPSLNTDQPEVTLSVIVPAFNEEQRLPKMMNQAVAYLSKRHNDDPTFTFEIIVVDDGSTDQTSTIALRYTNQYSAALVRLLKLNGNHGKGGAVCKGMLRARGKYLLMADADGATDFPDLERLERGMNAIENNELGIVVGSRAYLMEESLAERSLLRSFLMHGFHFLVDLLCVKGINDTQCGFKLFSRKAAQFVFTNQHIQRWAFDCELLYLANSAGIPVKEEAVKWKEVEGTKLNVAIASLQMLRDLVLIRVCYATGIWKADYRDILGTTK
mmetsp:Transcript_13435/g.17426  ORF Transcript_13435/g.17426 Transcript_13435/m.17426 type:complete len:332 (-) Transcript_13435:43-1038(-)